MSGVPLVKVNQPSVLSHLPFFGSKINSTPNYAVPVVPVNQKTGLATSTILILGISAFLILFYVLYRIVKIKKTNLQSVNFAKTPLEPSKNFIDLLAADNQLPEFNNGKEYAYSFWIYVDNVADDSNHGLVFFKSAASTIDNINFSDVNTAVYIEKNTNKLKIKLRTLNADQNNVTVDASATNKKGIDGILNIKTVNSNISLHADNCYYSDFTIDYVPLQRWLNVTINVDNNLVSIFLDGDLLSTKNLANPSTLECDNLLSSIISNKHGNLFIGTDVKSNLHTFNGALSNFTAFNYSITLDHVKALYNSGPIPASMLSKFGLPLYGVRNPFYRVDEIQTTTVAP
jgi:hypothetical protein